MNHHALQRLLPQARQVAHEAGRLIMGIYGDDFEVLVKADRSPITAADQRANALLQDRLARLGMALPVISEETLPPSFQQRRLWRHYWLVDPLDGTREFVARSDHFAVNIALVQDHRPVLGVVHAPALGQTWFGGPDLGAFRQPTGGEPLAIRAAPRVHDPMRVVLGRPDPGPRTEATLAQLPEHSTHIWGASLKFCLIAEGSADLFPRYGAISEWDMAAPQAILEAAGGHLTDMARMAPVRYNTRDNLTTSDVIAFADVNIDWRQYLAATTPEID